MARRKKGLVSTRRIKRIARNGRKAATMAMEARHIALLVGVPVTGIVTYLVSAANLPAEVTQFVTPMGLVAVLVGAFVLFA